MEKKMEITFMGYIGVIYGFNIGIYRVIWVVVKIMIPFWVPEILGAVL